MCVCVSGCMCVYVVYVNVFMCLCMCVCMCVCVGGWVYACLCSCVCVYVYLCMLLLVCIITVFIGHGQGCQATYTCDNFNVVAFGCNELLLLPITKFNILSLTSQMLWPWPTMNCSSHRISIIICNFSTWSQYDKCENPPGNTRAPNIGMFAKEFRKFKGLCDV